MMVAGRRFASAKAQPTEVSSILEERIRGVSEEANLNETGRVLSVGYVFFCFTEFFKEGRRSNYGEIIIDKSVENSLLWPTG